MSPGHVYLLEEHQLFVHQPSLAQKLEGRLGCPEHMQPIEL